MLVILALVAVQVLFGINYVVSKSVVNSFPPLVWASLRTWVSAALMLTVAFASRRPSPKGWREFFLPLIPLALLGTIINQVSFLVGLKYTTSTNSAIITTLIPVFTLLVVTLRGQEPMTLRKFIGFLLAFGGVLTIRKVENFTISDQTILGDLLNMANCLSYALFLSYGKGFVSTHDRLWTTAWLFAYGAVGTTLVAIPGFLDFQMPAIGGSLAWQMAFAVIGATFLTYFLNNWALAKAKSSMVALFIYIQPPVTSFVLWAFYGEIPSVRAMVSTCLIFAGLVVSIRKSEPAK